jgi:hypothetical protein
VVVKKPFSFSSRWRSRSRQCFSYRQPGQWVEFQQDVVGNLANCAIPMVRGFKLQARGCGNVNCNNEIREQSQCSNENSNRS